MKRAIVVTTVLCIGLLIGGEVNQTIYAEDLNNTVCQVIDLTQEDALNILLKNNNQINYIYQGNENDFKVLNENNLKGYVFLPNIETDLGYFIDKETKEVYYFHPSGHLELVK